MSEARFADAAVRLAGMAGALIGWAPDVFWGATPAELEPVLRALAGPQGEERALGSAELARLKEAFPDG